MVIQGVKVTADQSLTDEEIAMLVEDELQRWQDQGKTLGAVDLALEGDEIIVKAVERSPIRRVRRITGYLSTVDKFNEAKQAECSARTVHIP